MRAHSSIHILNSVLNSYLVVTTQLSSCVKKDFTSFTFALFGQKFSPEGLSLLTRYLILFKFGVINYYILLIIQMPY